MIAVIRIAVPLAESQLSAKTAGSAVGFSNTGGIRKIILSRPGIGMFGPEMPFRRVLTCGVPHAKTITVRIAQGISAVFSGSPPAGSGARFFAPSAFVQRKYKLKHTIEHAAAMMST